MVDFSTYKFRASQCHFLLIGNIGLSDTQKERIKELEARLTTKKGLTEKQQDDYNKLALKEDLTSAEKKKFDALVVKKDAVIGLTPKMEEELKELKKDAKKPLFELMPKTMKNELRKIWRAETFNRNFLFTNKYVQKGILQEEEAITLYQKYRKEVKGINTYFTKNDERLENDWFSGEWDLPKLSDVQRTKEGFDIKNSWSLDTLPFPCDRLDPKYEAQNQVYMSLTGAEKWTTAYCLVNGTEYLVFNEKQKHYYALNQPSEEDKYYGEYEEKCADVEKMMIFDYNRFVEVNGSHLMEISRDEWFEEGYDIPLKYRVVEKTSIRDEEFLDNLKLRVAIARDYMNSLNKEHECSVCGKPIEKEGLCGSRACYKADNE